MKAEETSDFGQVREIYEMAQKSSCAHPGRLAPALPARASFWADRRRLHHYLVEVRNWADRLLRDLTSESASTPGTPTKPQTEECQIVTW